MFAARNMTLARRFDSDALRWITAVEVADGSPIEEGCKLAMNQLIIDLKGASIYNKLDSLVIKMAARTLAGALIDVKNPTSSWTNNGFVSGDYNRTTGLIGNGSSKYLSSGINNNTLAQDDFAIFTYVTAVNTGTNDHYMGAGLGSTGGITFRRESASDVKFFGADSTGDVDANAQAAGLIGMRRTDSAEFQSRGGGANFTHTRTSQTLFDDIIYEYATSYASGTAANFSDHRSCAAGFGEYISLNNTETHLATFIASITALGL